MPSTADVSVTAIDYYERFQCIGADCPDTCCQGWNIPIENSIRDLHYAHDVANGTRLAESLITTDRGTLMKFSSSGYCPHLSSERLCGIYAEIGPHGQPQTCDTYPRAGIHYQVPHIELTTSLSCPVSVDEGIFREQPLQRKALSDADVGRLPLSEIQCGNQSTFDYIKAVRDLFITAMQMRDVSINRRLMALLLVSHRFRAMDYQSNFESLRALRKQLEGLVDTKLKDMPELPANQANQLGVLVELSKQMIFSLKQGEYAGADVNQQQLAIFDASFGGLGVRNFDELTVDHMKVYIAAQECYVNPWLAQHPHIIENLFVHHFMSEGFPFASSDSMKEQLLAPVINNLVIFGLLGGYAHSQGGLTDAMVKKLIYLFTRTITHNPELKQLLIKASQNLGALEPGQLYTLLAR